MAAEFFAFFRRELAGVGAGIGGSGGAWVAACATRCLLERRADEAGSGAAWDGLVSEVVFRFLAARAVTGVETTGEGAPAEGDEAFGFDEAAWVAA